MTEKIEQDMLSAFRKAGINTKSVSLSVSVQHDSKLTPEQMATEEKIKAGLSYSAPSK